MSDLEQVIAITRDFVIIFCFVSFTSFFIWICIKINSVISPLRRTSNNIESIVENVADKMSVPGSVWKGLVKGLSFLSRERDKSN